MRLGCGTVSAPDRSTGLAEATEGSRAIPFYYDLSERIHSHKRCFHRHLAWLAQTNRVFDLPAKYSCVSTAHF